MSINKVGKLKKNGLQKYKIRVNYTTNDGEYKQINRVVYGLEEAKRTEYELETEIKNGQSFAKMTVEELYNEYMKVKQYEIRESSLEKNRRTFRSYILPKIGNCRIDRLGSKLLQDWKISLEEKQFKLNTKQDAYGQLRALLNYAIRMEYLAKNPLIKVGNFKDALGLKNEMNFYTPEEFKKFIKVAKKCAIDYEKQYNSYYEWHFYVFFNIAFYTGLRKGEIHGLKWSSIDGEHISVTCSINQKLRKGEDVVTPPKNKYSIRTLQMPLPLIEVLKEQKKRQKKTNNYSDDSLILGDGRSIRDSCIQNRMKKYANIADMKTIRVHDFRHSHASLLANAGINIQEVAKRLGHGKIEMTLNTYAHLYPKEEEKAVEVLNAL